MGKFIALIIGLMGACWAYKGWFEYGFWVDNSPGGGFLAVIVGSLTVLLCLMELFKNQTPTTKLEKRHVLPVIATIIMLIAINYLGMIISFGLFIIGWLIILEKYTKLRALFIGLSSTVVIYFIFKFFLHVPFPTGYLGI
jgi:multisubunit Na+/H+ antiporter MnhB subunit